MPTHNFADFVKVIFIAVCMFSNDVDSSRDPYFTTTILTRMLFRSADDRLSVVSQSEVTNVKSFGAKGDGLTDDRPSIQAAIDKVHRNGGGTVFLPKGTYLLKSVQKEEGIRLYLLNIFSGISLVGEAQNSTVIKSAPSMPDETRIISADSANGKKELVSNVVFQDFTIDGSATQQNEARSMVGISMVHTQGIVHRNVTVKNIKGTAEREGTNFDSFYSSGNRYIDCTALTTLDTKKMTGSGFSATESSDITYLRCHSYNSGWWMGFTTFNSRNISYQQCDAALNFQRGFNAESSINVTYDRCSSAPINSINGIRVSNSVKSWDGFYAFRSKTVRYNECVSRANRGSGLFNNGSTDLRVSNSQFDQNGSGIGFDNEKDCAEATINGTKMRGNRVLIGVLHASAGGVNDRRCTPAQIISSPAGPISSGPPQ